MYSTRSYPIQYGDRIFIRVIQNYSAILETTFENVDGFTHIFSEIRYLLRHLRGMVKVSIRNYHRGWSTDRMLKLYGNFPQPGRYSQSERFSILKTSSAPSMLMPWQM